MLVLTKLFHLLLGASASLAFLMQSTVDSYNAVYIMDGMGKLVFSNDCEINSVSFTAIFLMMDNRLFNQNSHLTFHICSVTSEVFNYEKKERSFDFDDEYDVALGNDQAF